jgi:hypothetical protein
VRGFEKVDFGSGGSFLKGAEALGRRAASERWRPEEKVA